MIPDECVVFLAGVSQIGNEVALTFVNGLDFQLLPQRRVKYEEPDIENQSI